jgi:hypothetical protein
MADSSPIILQKIDAGLIASIPKPRPDAVFVLSYGGGGLKTFNRTPPMSERIGSKYCYIVDLSERHTSGSLRIPAMGDVYFFQLGYDATWQVTDPEVVIRRNIGDGDAVVAGFLRDALWQIGRSYPPSAVQGAEDEARRYLEPPFDLGGGLAVTWLSIRLALDERQSEAAVEVDADAHSGRLARTRVQRLRGLLDGDESFLLLHLAQHPEDTGSVLQMITTSRERNEQLRLGLLDRMLERGFVQDADIGPLRDSILGAPGSLVLPPSRPLPPALAPAPVQVVQPAGSNVDPRGAVVPEDETSAASAPFPAPENVTNWKPVRRGKPNR